MSDREKHAQQIGDILILYGLLLLFAFICRLWPVILLAVLSLFAAMLWMLYRTVRKLTEEDGKEPVLETSQNTKLSSQELELAVFQDMEDQITELVLTHWQDAVWQWDCPDARQRIYAGNDIHILLNHAGGYRKARVVYQGIRVYGLDYSGRKKAPVPEESFEDTGDSEPEVMNYQLIAFQWCEAHLQAIHDWCSEAGQNGQNEVLIPLGELPAPESWNDICRELIRQCGLQARIMTDGILIIL